MTKTTTSSRRSFLKVGALAAAPLAGAGAAMAAEGGGDARLQRLQDEAALHRLHQDWLREVNAGDPGRAGLAEGLRSIAADHAGAPDLIELAADGVRAVGRFACRVEIETPLPREGAFALVQMAHAQGNAATRRTERRTVVAEYVRAGAGWAIARVELASA